MMGPARSLVSFATGCAAGAAAACAARAWERKRMVEAGTFYEYDGRYFQVLGHAWDYFRRDFSVLYRPLHHCDAELGVHEAHVLASSHFEHFGCYRPVEFSELDPPSQSRALPGPFWQDAGWALPALTEPLAGPAVEERRSSQAAFAQAAAALAASGSGASPTSSGFGTRSHQLNATRRLL